MGRMAIPRYSAHSAYRTCRGNTLMKSFSDSLECATQLYVAERLAGYGTRPPIIANLCGIQLKKAKLMYGDILGRSPPSGM